MFSTPFFQIKRKQNLKLNQNPNHPWQRPQHTQSHAALQHLRNEPWFSQQVVTKKHWAAAKEPSNSYTPLFGQMFKIPQKKPKGIRPVMYTPWGMYYREENTSLDSSNATGKRLHFLEYGINNLWSEFGN